jgi:hypothetical protein
LEQLKVAGSLRDVEKWVYREKLLRVDSN